MKALARSYVWWPCIDASIQNYVAGCKSCQETRHAPPRAPVHPWEVPSVPWSRLHVDFAGPFQGRKFIIVVDSYSKYTEVKQMSSTNAEATIDVFRELFATHGIPDVVVSDNGPPFTSNEYTNFLEGNAIRRVLIAPRRPAGNGQAERVVQTTKDALKRIEGPWKKRLAQFLLHQHITPSTTTGLSPGELLMGRKLRSCLDRMHPDFLKEQRERQELEFQKSSTCRRPLRQFEADDPVLVRNYSQGPEWIPAVITKATGPVSYQATTETGDVVRRHVDQMQKGCSTIPVPAPSDAPPTDPVDPPTDAPTTAPVKSELPSEPVRIRPKRETRKPDRFGNPVYF